jgi:hypothetical protein
VTPFPSIDLGDLANGATYRSRRFEPNVSMTIPAQGEWHAAGADNPDHVELEPEPVPPIFSSGISFHHMTRVFPPETGGVQPGGRGGRPGRLRAVADQPPAPADDEAQAGRGARPQGRGDRRARQVEPAAEVKDCGKVEGECVVMFIGSVEPIVYGSKVFGRFYVLQQPDGKQLVVEEFAEPASAFKQARPPLDAVLRSARLAP